MMKALVTKGKDKGQTVLISQWCNDWFASDSSKVFSPSSLAFSVRGFNIIKRNKNNGMLFDWFEPTEYMNAYNQNRFIMTFKKRLLHN